MSRIAYVNGAFVPITHAAVHVEDRGYQFADGVYEVWSVRCGRMLDVEGHYQRLERSLRELRIMAPMGSASLAFVLRETLRQNRVRDGYVYLQITRGVAPRDHAFPDPPVRRSIVITARAINMRRVEQRMREGVKVITTPDNRWGRCDIKTVGLLPNVLAKQAAREAGAFEAWFVDADGAITEGASTNAWIVNAAGVLVTRDTHSNILRGVTRASVIRIAREMQMQVEERPFSLEEALAAREAFLTSASGAAVPVIAIDGKPVGDGAPGHISARLHSAYLAGT